MEPLRTENAGQTLTVTFAARIPPRSARSRAAVGLRGRTRRPCGKPSPPGGCSVRADRVLLAGGDGMGAAAVQVGLPDRALSVRGPAGVGPVDVACIDRHPGRVKVADVNGTGGGAVE